METYRNVKFKGCEKQYYNHHAEEKKVFYNHFSTTKHLKKQVPWSELKHHRKIFATVAFKVEKELLTYAISYCSPEDTPIKFLGRRLAAKKLNRGLGTCIEFNPDWSGMNPYKLCLLCLIHSINNKTAPSWVYRLKMTPDDYEESVLESILLEHYDI